MGFGREIRNEGDGLIYCCEKHQRIPPDQKSLFHNETIDLGTGEVKLLTPKQRWQQEETKRKSYTCQVCRLTWKRNGSWMQAKAHEKTSAELGNAHPITQNGIRKTWLAEA